MGKNAEMDETDKKLVELLMIGVPVASHPFRPVAKPLGVSEEEIVRRLRNLKEAGVIKRFGVSVNHIKLGYVANAMAVWKVPSERSSEVGKIMAGFAEVTHCYERPIYPGKWEYNVFSMIHAKSREECEKIIERISQKTGISDFRIIYSTREFKKTGARIVASQL